MSSSSTRKSRRLISKSDMLTLIPANSHGSPMVVRVVVERGSITLKSLGNQSAFRKAKMDAKHDLKVVWVSDLINDEIGQIKNCFVVITPEQNYILQAVSHRNKIEWMQSLSIAISQSLKFRGSYRPSSWSNLDDLYKWLMVREVTYTFKTHEVYKGAVYSGKWNMGMPHAYGRMKWSNGNCYDGEFLDGKFHGSGTMMWLSHPKHRHYTGSWQAGIIEGFGEMMYSDHSVYTGWWHMGMRHRHGRMEYRSDNSSYTGGWELDKRHGYGVMDFRDKCERYLGMWIEDRQHGAGIQVARNKYQFSGSFINGKRSYDLTRSMRRKSIMVIQDSKWEALFRSTAADLEQMVSAAHGEFETTAPQTPMTDVDSAVAMDFSDIVTDQEDSWDPKARLTPVKLDGCSSGVHTRMGSTTSSSILGLQHSCPAQFGGEACAVCNVEGFRSTNHPLGQLVNSLTKCFVESYSGIAVNTNLLPHAISELCSITTRLHLLVKRHCPSVITTDEDQILGRPRTQLSMLVKSKKQTKRQRSSYFDDPVMADYSWLYPIILPSIFPTLFELYKEHYSRDDRKIGCMIRTLNSNSDEELCGILQIRSTYEEWKSYSKTHDNETSEEESEQTFSNFLKTATKIFSSFSDYSTPNNKLLCIEEVSKELTQLLSLLDQDKTLPTDPSQDYYESRCSGSEFSIPSPEPREGEGSEFEDDGVFEDTLPVGILTFVIVRSRVKNLYSEIQYIQDFTGSTQLRTKFGPLMSCLKDSFYQLLELKL